MRQNAYSDWLRISFAVTMKCLGFYISSYQKEDVYLISYIETFFNIHIIYKLKLICVAILNALQIL